MAANRMTIQMHWHTLCDAPYRELLFGFLVTPYAIVNNSVFIFFRLPEISPYLYSIFTYDDCACSPRDALLNNRQAGIERDPIVMAELPTCSRRQGGHRFAEGCNVLLLHFKFNFASTNDIVSPTRGAFPGDYQ